MVKCVACGQWLFRKARFTRKTTCLVCGKPLEELADRLAADARLRQALHDWLTAAPAYRGATYDRTTNLTLQHAIDDLATVVRAGPLWEFCPQRLQLSPNSSSSSEHEDLMFVHLSPTLPRGHSRVLSRRVLRYRHRTDPDPVQVIEFGSVFRSAGSGTTILWEY